MILNLEEHMNKLIDDVSLIISEYTVQLYYINETEHYPVATGVLIKSKNEKYLITAAHVFDETEKERIVIGHDKYYTKIFGELYFTNILKSEQNALVDLAAYKLHEATINNLIELKYQFCDINRFDLDSSFKEDEIYLILGYPLTRSKNKSNKSQKDKVFSFATSEIEKVKIIDTNSNVHRFFKYRIARILKSDRKGPCQGPKPRGMSGCFIWKIPDIFNIDPIRFNPLAIFIEHDNETNTVIATKGNFIVEFIKTIFKDDIKLKTNVKLEILAANGSV